MRLFVLLFCVCCCVPVRASDIDPADAVHIATLTGAAPNQTDIELHLAVHDGTITHAIAITPRYNKGVHGVDVSKLKIRDGSPQGEVALTLRPDAYMPKDGQPVRWQFKLAAAKYRLYEGAVGEAKRADSFTVDVKPHVDLRDGRHRISARFFGAFVRLWRAKGPNWRYALDMDMTLGLRDGKVGIVKMASIVPDYRRYDAVVEKHDLNVEANRIHGTVHVMLDHGGQGSKRDAGPRKERYVYTIDATVINDVIAGRWNATFGDETEKSRPLLGKVSHEAPPAPAASIATLRLHGAMFDDWPVLLTVGLADDGRLNGFAWASAYNHQPHTLDASKLKLDRDRLHGEVAVTICPDCYKPPEIFTMRYDIDARIDGFDIDGAFTGNDSRNDVKGAVSGSLRPRDAVELPTLKDLKSIKCHFGYALVTGKMPKGNWQKHKPNYLDVTFDLVDGEVTATEAANPWNKDLFEAEMLASTVKLDGDRLHGTVRFKLAADVLPDGVYDYSFEAIVNGSKAFGYWRGTFNDKPVYTKSAKLSAELTPIAPQ